MGNLAPDAVQLHPGKHNKEGRGGCSPYLFSVFRHFFFQPHANNFRKLTLHLSFCLFLSEILGICYASCVCSARTYVYYLTSSPTQMPEPFPLSPLPPFPTYYPFFFPGSFCAASGLPHCDIPL